ncbi:hypothetical protein GGI25_004625 [Coemansia spiralis]|uniref:Uncharacterized protein n=2 Tax=Coemansia TaxID=4863 RepID=A0A9W8G041_9FUNG|nr:hypothetical protein EDC05_004550 [Coemansia umbellata]KAJ2620428.1 hypothetical protein GGI26_004998 [Coemansia sp. RSA 1358]KAJ2673640.1 hypothetical protein GGI25_004625 [Coemansia spiralis]
MEAANSLSRQAAEYENKRQWTKAAESHRLAAAAYKSIDTFDFDPVATLTLASLANRHIRWAEYCEREDENEARCIASNAVAPTEQQDSNLGTLEEAEASTQAAGPANGDNEKEEREFEDFWQYMQNWLANPAAFTRPPLTSTKNSRGGSRNNWGVDAGAPSRSIMESFYLVGSNPEQNASIYGPVAATPRTMSPMQTLGEIDESKNEGDQHNLAKISEPIAAIKTEPETNSSSSAGAQNGDKTANALHAENRKLRKLLLHMHERVRTLETAAQENTMLKSSIHSFREEFHRHANAVSMPRIHEHVPVLPRRVDAPSVAGATSAGDVHLHQLEQQVQLLQLENAKQRLQVTKYKERWERLKESAKRKRQQQEQEMMKQQHGSPSHPA